MLRVWTLEMPAVMSHCARLHLLCNATPRPRHLITDNIVFYTFSTHCVLAELWQTVVLSQNSPNNSKFLIFVKNHHHHLCPQHWPDDCSVAKQTRKQIKWLAVETQTKHRGCCVFIQGVVLRVFIQGVVLRANTVTHRKHRFFV